MDFIWSLAALERLFSHRSRDVQEWAVRRAFDLYPDVAADRVIALIPSAPVDTVQLILRRLKEVDSPVTNLVPLVDLAISDAEPEVTALARAVLLRAGYTLLPHEMELDGATHHADIVGSTARGFGRVLEAYRVSEDDTESILDGIARLHGFEDVFRELAEATDEKKTKKRVRYFKRIWGAGVPNPDRLLQPDRILSDSGKAVEGESTGNSTPWKQALLAELEEDRTRLTKVHEIAKGRAFGSSPDERKFFQALLLCLARNEACRRHLLAATDAERLCRAVVMKPWRGLPDQALLDFFRSARPEDLLGTVSKVLDYDYSYASYVLRLLNAVDVPGRLKLFMDVFEGKRYGDVMAEEAEKALWSAGNQAVEYVIQNYPRMSSSLRTLILFVLDSFPTPQVVDFCLKHFDEYMRSQDSWEFVECLGEIASVDFLAPLLGEWKEGETQIGEAIRLISEIHDITNDKIQRVVQDIEAEMRRLEEPDRPLSSFSLRCTSCGHTYQYELKNIYMDKNGDPAVGDIIQCKGCGSIETYEMTTLARFGFTAELLRIAAIKKAAPEKTLDDIDTPFHLAEHVTIQALGHNVKSVSEAYHVLKTELEKRPDDATLQRRMGNVLRNGGRPDLGLPYYLEALRLDPNEADSCACIAGILIDEGQHKEAIPYLERLVPLCRESRMNEDLRRRIFAFLLEQTYVVQQETGHKVDLFRLAKPNEMLASDGSVTIDARTFEPSEPEDFEALYHLFRYGRIPVSASSQETIDAWPEVPRLQPIVRSAPKLGRNDPCPCGSGKKYKKCCGR